MSQPLISIEVAFALPNMQEIKSLKVPEGTTAMEAVEISSLLTKFPQIMPENLSLGVFSKAVKPDHVLREGDRVEIYRPLIADPKEVRRKKAEATKQAKAEKKDAS